MLRRTARKVKNFFSSRLPPIVETKVVRFYQKREIRRVKRKGKAKVAFLVVHRSVWKYERLYKLMKNSPRYDPILIVCPYKRGNKNIREEELKKTFKYFSDSGYDTVKSSNINRSAHMSINDFDIIFFTNPHDITSTKYQIKNLKYKITCYAPYFFVVNGRDDLNFKKDFQRLVWRQFCETEIHKDLFREHSPNKDKNVVVSGYPGLDPLIDRSYTPSSPWIAKNKKRIIWAPHHTIEGQGASLDYSNFLEYSALMINVSEMYDQEVNFAFKPHPMLKEKLYKHDSWGKDRTEEYYASWSRRSNCQVEEGQYKDLFLTSDALIHDCSSFMVEYLCTENPVLYTLKDESVGGRMNKLGRMALEVHYKASNSEDIINFIEHVVIGESDHMEDTRTNFVKKYLTPPNNNTASQNILNYISTAVLNHN